MVEYMEIRGLNGKNSFLKLDFNKDLTILTGKNGCGKTTVMKMLWYALSNNIEKLIREINFEELAFYTNKHEVKIIRKEGSILVDEEGIQTVYDESDFLRMRNICIHSVKCNSIYFPTFRRIEGGYSDERRLFDDLSDSLDRISKQLSNGNHKFVTSISTIDIENLVRDEALSKWRQSSKIQSDTMNNVRELIQNKQKNKEDLFDQIQKEITNADIQSDILLKPFMELEETIKSIYKEKGIDLSVLKFGSNNMIPSDKLSAGEKQMLSFLCYNMFSHECTIIIDEPELSLHPDWQRKLMPTLLKQNKDNQFIIATHSPFIYSQYPDKEIEMDIKGE